MDKHYFASANTSKGFVSHFDEVIKAQDAVRIIYLKGGGGTGKSTLMKKIGKELSSRGQSVEYCHCSSDPASLDGVCNAELGIAMFDGTAPHTMDPLLPGVFDMILNLADFLDTSILKKSRKELLLYCDEKAKAFKKGYAYLKSAKALLSHDAPDFELADAVADTIIKNHGILRTGTPRGKRRNLFASGITPIGVTDFLDTLMLGEVIGLTDSPEAPLVLNKVVDTAIASGHNVDAFFCPFNPEKTEHAVIRDLGISFTTINRYHSNTDFCELYEFDKALPVPETVYLIDKAVDEFSRAKNIHAEIEKIYIPAMDFDALNNKYNKILEMLLS